MAKLQIGDNDSGMYHKEYLVTQCRYSFMRNHNRYYPDSTAKCGTVEVTIIAPGKEDLELFEWYINLQACSGRIVFDLSNQLVNEYAPTRTLFFEEARCFSLKEDYHIDKASRRVVKLEFVAENMVIDTVPFINHNS